jgi:hypothetical protein
MQRHPRVSSNNRAAFRAVFAGSCSCVVGSISATANCLPSTEPALGSQLNPQFAEKFIPDVDERLNDFIERLDRRNAAGTMALAREPRNLEKSRLCARSAPTLLGGAKGLFDHPQSFCNRA